MTAPTFLDAMCELVVDDLYRDVLRREIQSAVRRCLVTMFIIDLKSHCITNCVVEVIDDLEEAKWRGVDVRVLIGGSRSTFAIAEAAAIAQDHLSSRAIPNRWMTSTKGERGSHAKMVVIDETVLLGSHNWSPGAFYSDTQDSIRIVSKSLAEYFAVEFERGWRSHHA